jgi:hypothetical protein
LGWIAGLTAGSLGCGAGVLFLSGDVILPAIGYILDRMSRLEFSMSTSTTYRGPIGLGGGFRLPATSKITLGGGFRLPAVKPADSKIVLGGGFRLPVAR